MNILTTRFGLIQACETDVILDSGRIARVPFVHSVTSIFPTRLSTVCPGCRA